MLDRAGVTESYTYHTLSREVVDELKRLRPELVVGFIVPINFGGVPKVKADFLVIEQQSYSDQFIHQAWAAGYNVLGIPLAAGVLYPAFHILLSPWIAAAAMALSSVSVLSNSLRLRVWEPSQ